MANNYPSLGIKLLLLNFFLGVYFKGFTDALYKHAFCLYIIVFNVCKSNTKLVELQCYLRCLKLIILVTTFIGDSISPFPKTRDADNVGKPPIVYPVLYFFRYFLLVAEVQALKCPYSQFLTSSIFVSSSSLRT